MRLSGRAPILVGKTLFATQKEELHKKLDRFECKTYKDYLKTRRWLNKRAPKLMKDECYCCFARNVEFIVRHVSIENLGRERPDDVITVCRICNKQIGTTFNPDKIEAVRTQNKYERDFKRREANCGGSP